MISFLRICEGPILVKSSPATIIQARNSILQLPSCELAIHYQAVSGTGNESE
jgi:hypothetical protein